MDVATGANEATASEATGANEATGATGANEATGLRVLVFMDGLGWNLCVRKRADHNFTSRLRETSIT